MIFEITSCVIKTYRIRSRDQYNLQAIIISSYKVWINSLKQSPRNTNTEVLTQMDNRTARSTLLQTHSYKSMPVKKYKKCTWFKSVYNLQSKKTAASIKSLVKFSAAEIVANKLKAHNSSAHFGQR